MHVDVWVLVGGCVCLLAIAHVISTACALHAVDDLGHHYRRSVAPQMEGRSSNDGECLVQAGIVSGQCSISDAGML